MNADDRVIRRILADYDIGEVQVVRRHGGTAGGGTWKVETDKGAWLVRARNVLTSSEDAVAFDHGLRRHLIRCGVPTAAPLTTREGGAFTCIEEKTYEVYPFIAGRVLERASLVSLADAAGTLAMFHEAAATYPLAKKAPSRTQYGRLGVNESSDRMEDPRLLALIYARLAAEPEAQRFGEALEFCGGWLERLRTEFGPAAYDALPKALTHGDYTLANLLFDDEGQVVGVFDFDWARWAPRVRDVADGMYFIGAQRRSPLEAADIWSMTETADFDVERCVTWLSAYQEISPLSAAEVDAIPLAFAARWLSVRVEGTAKVPPDQRVLFCQRGITEPLRWLDEHWHEVRNALRERKTST